MYRTFSLCAATLLISASAYAQDAKDTGEVPPEAPVAKVNSVNASPLGMLVGSYSINYERMFGPHGLLVEGSYASSSDGDTSSNSMGGVLGYRWHWNGTQNSWFTGVNLGFATGTGDAVVTSGGTSETFNVDTTAVTGTVNIGRRWAWDSGFNITFRIGAGYGNYDVTTDSDDPLAQDAVELVDDLLTILPVAFDGELSVGWVF
jgi:hypothetical protein